MFTKFHKMMEKCHRIFQTDDKNLSKLEAKQMIYYFFPPTKTSVKLYNIIFKRYLQLKLSSIQNPEHN